MFVLFKDFVFGYCNLPFLLLKLYNKNNKVAFLRIHEKKENLDLTERQISLKNYRHEELKNILIR